MKNICIAILIFTFAAGLYALTLRGGFGNATTLSEANKLTQVGQPFESSHERSPYASMVALMHGQVDLTTEWANFASPDVGYIGGKFYSFFPVGVPALIYPLYSLGLPYNVGLLAGFSTMAIMSLLSMLLLVLIAKQVFKMPFWAALAVGLLFAFATTSWSYAVTIYQHAPTVTCMLFGFYAAWQYARAGKFAWLWSALGGIAYGVAIFIDYPNALLCAPNMVYMVVSSINFKENKQAWSLHIRASILAGLLLFGAITAGHLYYNKQVFGSALQFHNPAPRYTPETFDALRAKLQEKQTTNKASTALSIFNEYSLGQGVYELSVALDKGIFFYSPIFLLAILGLVKFRKRFKLEHAIFVSMAFINVAMYASFGDPWGGWAFGPRYLIPTMALLSVFAIVPIIEGRSIFFKKIVTLLLIAYSSAVAILGVVTTNLVPPKVEADYLHLKYNYLRNFDFIKSNTSDNFIYNTYLIQHMTLLQYAEVIFGIIILLFIVVLFLLPLLYKKENNPYADNSTKTIEAGGQYV